MFTFHHWDSDIVGACYALVDQRLSVDCWDVHARDHIRCSEYLAVVYALWGPDSAASIFRPASPGSLLSGECQLGLSLHGGFLCGGLDHLCIGVQLAVGISEDVVRLVPAVPVVPGPSVYTGLVQQLPRVAGGAEHGCGGLCDCGVYGLAIYNQAHDTIPTQHRSGVLSWVHRHLLDDR